MPTDASQFRHISYPMAVNLAAQIDATTASADTLCQSGFSPPVAIEIARQINANTGDARTLHDFCQMSASDAAAIATAISARSAA